MDYGQRDLLTLGCWTCVRATALTSWWRRGVTGDESGVHTNMEAGIVATGGTTMDTGRDDYEGRAYTSVSLLIVSLPRLFLSLSCTASLLPLLHVSAHLSVWCGRGVATCGVLVRTPVNSRGLVVETSERVPLKHRRVMKKSGKVESKSRDCESAF